MTNESFFFRDRIPFELFRGTIMPQLLAARAARRRIRIWCAAASTGQEPYSLAMSLKEMGERISGWHIEIVATDLCSEVLERARSGIYSQFEVQRGLPIRLLVRHFTQAGDTWHIASDIREMVQFRTLNLLQDFAPLGMFDVVLCRNVLIYFDQPTKVAVLERLARQVPQDGYLILGAAETVVGLSEAFRPIPERRGIFGPSAVAKRQSSVPRSTVRAS